MKFIQKISLLLLVIVISSSVQSQETVKTVPVFKKQIDYEFTSEWQYVSTDLYLFNADKFNKMINDMYIPKKKKLKKRDEIVENILITASLDGLQNYENIEYPIYNFTVSKTEEGRFSTQASSNEVIRVLENYPNSSISNHIGAKIKVDVITDKNKSFLYKLVASQLQNISALSNPTDAAMQLVGEFGKMMEKDAIGKEYHFESTIRLYEEQDFNTRFHSLNIFVFMPSSVRSAHFDTLDISNFITNASNPVVTREVLEKFIDYYTYPFMITVNYRSKYIPEIPDMVNFQSLKARESKCESNHNSGLINDDIYKQEKQLIKFLETFAQLKLDVNNYELDYKNKITEDYTIHTFIIMQDLMKLKITYNNIIFVNSGKPEFEDKFHQIYDDFIVKAELFLESNNNLRDVKHLVNTILELENTPDVKLDSLNREEYLRKLYLVDLPEREANSAEVKNINQWISKIENKHFKEIYDKKIYNLQKKAVNTESYELALGLESSVRNTNCVTCREQASSTVEKFMQEYEKYERKVAFNNLENLKTQTNTLIYQLSKQETYISLHLETDYEGELPPHIQIINTDFKQLIKDKEELQILIKASHYKSDFQEINSATEQINLLSLKLKNGFATICTQEPKLCKEIIFEEDEH